MRRPFVLTATLSFVVLAWCVSAFALNPDLDISQYAHTAWKVRDGFVKGAINSIAQTPDGYLWLGTEFGLYRFDGVRPVAWKPPAGHQLPGAIYRLLVARDGTLWIGTTEGLATLKNGKLIVRPEFERQYISSLLETGDNTIWVGTSELPNLSKLCAIRDERVECRGGEGSLGPIISGLYEDSKGTLWAGGVNGCWRWIPNPPEFFPVNSLPDGIRVFSESADGELLIGAETGLMRFVNGQFTAYSPLGLGPQAGIQDALRDRDQGFWFSTHERGLVHWRSGKADTFSQSDGLTGDNVTDLFEDREGNIWVATSAGLDRFRPYNIPTIAAKEGLANADVWSVLATSDGSILIGTNRGLHRWKQGEISLFPAAQDAQKPYGMFDRLAPTNLFQDSSGRIWVSTYREFGYLNGGRFSPVSGYPGGIVHGIAGGPAGQLWLSNQQSGLFHVVRGAVAQQFPLATLGHKDYVNAITPDPSKGGLWLGFRQGGIAYFANGTVQRSYSAENGLGEGRVNQLSFGTDGVLWAATEGGLSWVKDGRVITLTSKNGLPCDAVHWMMKDDVGSVWLEMRCGLVRVQNSDLEAWVAKPARTVNATIFDAMDGVQSASTAGGYKPQVTKSADGRIWLAIGVGLSVIDPHHLPFNTLPPPVHIERIVADGKECDTSNGLQLPARVQHIDIDYTALSLVVPEKNRFRFKLEGYDSDWRDVGNRRQAFYTNLEPRKYRFRVIACNNSGVWNETGATLEFSIAPAYYQTLWFRALCVAAFFVLLWALYQRRLHVIRRQYAAGLEASVSERLRIARELHDTLLQSIQGAAFQLQTARKLLLRKADNGMEALDEAIAATDEAITEGRSAIHDLRPEPVAQRSLPELLTATGRELADTHQLNGTAPAFHVIVEGKQRDLARMLQDEVFRISREVIRNAFTHARASRIEVEIHYDNDQLRVRIRDDGKGIAPQILKAGGQSGHFGIPGIRERAQHIGSRLQFWSEAGAGTEVELAVPAAMAYRKQRNGRRFRLFHRADSEK